MNKKGSHVGVILSFVIFITFVIFVYMIVQPVLKRPQNKQSTIDFLEPKIIGLISSNLTTINIGPIGTNVPRKCAEFQNLIGNAGLENFNIILKDKSWLIDNAYKNSSKFIVNKWNGGSDFFKIYQSNEFNLIENLTDSNCSWGIYSLVKDQNYTFGLIKTKSYAFDGKIYNLIKYSIDNYTYLKEDLEFTEGNDFAIDFDFNNGTVLEGKQIDLDTNVYVKEIPMMYFNKNADIYYGYLRIKVW